MIYLIVGTLDSGKSQRAEELICELSKKNKYYVATMIPYGTEGLNRIKKHRKMREGKGFITLEAPYDICEVLNIMEEPKESAVLVECMTNLVANLYFEQKKSQDELVKLIFGQVTKLKNAVASVVIVTNEYDKLNPDYDEETLLYIELMGRVNQEIRQMADYVEVMKKCK